MKLKRNMTIYISAIDIADILARETPEGIAKVFNAIGEKLHNQTTESGFRLNLITPCLNPYSRWLFETMTANIKKEKEK